MCCTIILILLAVLFPPIPVIYLEGFYSKDFLLNVLLLMLGYVPGVIHAIYLIFHSDRGARHGYRDIECQSHDAIYQQGWDDRQRLESATTSAPADPKQAPPPYSME